MKRLLLLSGLLAVCLNLFAIEFLGVELSGNVEEVADKFAEKGFTRLMGTIQEGPDKGKPAVVQTEDFLFLEGKFAGEDARIILRTENQDNLVTGIFLDIIKPSFGNLYPNIWKRISENLIKDYGQPDVTYNSLTDTVSVDSDGIIFLKYWKKAEGVIRLILEDTNTILININQE